MSNNYKTKSVKTTLNPRNNKQFIKSMITWSKNMKKQEKKLVRN